MKFRDIKAFIKQLGKNKLYSVVTIFGFSVSLMFVILLSLYIKQELSVDKFHAKKDRLYRLVNEGGSNFGSTIGQKIKDALPEVECETRVHYYKDFFYTQGAPEKKLTVDLLMVDSTFFNMFSFKLEEGSASDVLLLKNSAVITRHFARLLFGDESPVGKQFISSNNVPLTVTGIMDDFPENTQFKKCDAVVNFQSIADFWSYPQVLTSDGASFVNYYFLAKKGTNLPAKSGQALALLKKDFWMYRQERVKTLDFEPITASYFSNKRGEIKQNSKTLVTVLSGITLLILILSIINYINLTIAHSGFRNKEVAIKKLMGSSRGSLIRQHVSESVFICFIAFGLGILLSSVARPVFNSLLETNINVIENVSISTIAGFVAIVLLVGAISGIIPAFYLTGLNPAEVVKGSFQKKNKTAYSKVLVSFQFTTTIALIICASFIVKQTKFLRNYDLGFNKENIIELQADFSSSQRQTFGNILASIPGIQQFSFVAGSPLDGGNNQSFIYNGNPVSFSEFYVDSAFFSLMGIKYEKTGIAWSDNVLWLNKATIRELNLDPLPKSFKRHDKELPVYGVVEDYHFNDLKQTVGLSMLRPLSGESWSILIKISGTNVSGTIDKIKSEWNNYTDGVPFVCHFADATIDSWYKKEANTSKIVSWFSMLAIIISIMGIFALVMYYNQLRIKEIGIRKVNGAKISEILKMLNKDFVKWVVIAFVIATPIAYYAMNKWLESFAYKTSLSWWIFALAGVLALGITLLTVSWQSWRAATRNPVETLGYE